MTDKKPPAESLGAAPVESAAEQKARAALADPELQKALAELRQVTPEGEPMFGFQLKIKDARGDVPVAEEVQIEDGAAIIAHKQAAAAYVDEAVPAVAPSPRMPSGRVRIVDDATAAAARAAMATRRQVTQPSILRGGTGPRPPALKEEQISDAPVDRSRETERGEPQEQEETAVGTVLDRTMPPARSTQAAASPKKSSARQERSEGGRRYGSVMVLLGACAVGGIVTAVLLRGPNEPGESGVTMGSATAGSSARAVGSATASGTAPGKTPATSTPSPDATARATTTVSPPATVSAAPTTTAPASSGVPTAAPRPNPVPGGTTVPPAVTAGPSGSSSAKPALTAPPPAVPTQAPPAPTSTVKKPYFELED